MKHLFEHECGCCVYNGSLIKDGDWKNNVVESNHNNPGDTKTNDISTNITCIKGILYDMKKHEDGNILLGPSYYSEEEENEGLEQLKSNYEELNIEDYPTKPIPLGNVGGKDLLQIYPHYDT